MSQSEWIAREIELCEEHNAKCWYDQMIEHGGRAQRKIAAGIRARFPDAF